MVDAGGDTLGEGEAAYWKGPPAWELLFWFLAIVFHIGEDIYELECPQ